MLLQGTSNKFTERLRAIPEQINSPFNITEVFINCQSFYFFRCLSSVKYKLCTQTWISLAPQWPSGNPIWVQTDEKVSQLSSIIENNQESEDSGCGPQPQRSPSRIAGVMEFGGLELLFFFFSSFLNCSGLRITLWLRNIAELDFICIYKIPTYF